MSSREIAEPAAAAVAGVRVGRPLSRGELVADAAVHAAGIALSLMAIPVMIVIAALLHGDGALIAAVSVYGAAMLAMFGCSAAYNLCPETRAKARAILRRFDHAAIYLKIAGCQTPFAVLVGGAHVGWALLAVWAGAVGGAAAKLIAPDRLQRLSVLFYIALGWAGAALLFPAADSQPLDTATAILALVGGALYTAGVGFFLWERLPFHNAIWHGFVVVATFTFYSAVIVEVSLRAG